MKDRIITFVQGVIVCVVIIGVLGVCGYIETHYTMEAEVVGVQGDEVTIEDKVGYTFVFYGDNYEIGDKVKVTFSTNYTEINRQDDEIVKVKEA